MLDPGEAEAIALAIERAPSLLLIDEREGRQVARTLGVPLTGTLGILLRAKGLGHTPAIKPLLTELIEQHHFRLHPSLVLSAAGSILSMITVLRCSSPGANSTFAKPTSRLMRLPPADVRYTYGTALPFTAPVLRTLKLTVNAPPVASCTAL